MSNIGTSNVFKGYKFLELRNNGTSTTIRSTDDYGVTWKPQVVLTTSVCKNLLYDGDSLYVAAGESGVKVSENGVVWTDTAGLPSNTGNVLLAYIEPIGPVVAYCNGRFYTLQKIGNPEIPYAWALSAYIPVGTITSMVFDKLYYDHTGEKAIMAVIEGSGAVKSTAIRYTFDSASQRITTYSYSSTLDTQPLEYIRDVYICNNVYVFVDPSHIISVNILGRIYTVSYINGVMGNLILRHSSTGPINGVVYHAPSGKYIIAGGNSDVGPVLRSTTDITTGTSLATWVPESIGRTLINPNNSIAAISTSNDKIALTFTDATEMPLIMSIGKQSRAAPLAPTASSITSNSIVWNNSTGTSITCNNETKTAGSIWSGLTPGVPYTAYAYYPEDSTYNQSGNSPDATATTLRLPQSAPSNPIASNIAFDSITWTSDNGSKIVCNGQTKDSGSVWSGLLPTTVYTAYAYMPTDATHEASANSSSISATTSADPNPSAPNAPNATIQSFVNIKWDSEPATKITMSGLSLEVWENRPEAAAIDFYMTRYTDNNVYLNECQACLAATYASSPTSTSWINEFAIRPINKLNYVSRIKGYITVDITGTYFLQITSDDYSELWLSTNEDETNKAMVARCQNAIVYNENNEEPLYQSSPYITVGINLEKGKRYYIETRHIQGPGGDFLIVRWKGTSIMTPTLIKDHNILRIGDKNTGEVWSNLAEEQYFYAYSFKPMAGGGIGPLSNAGVGRTGKVRQEQTAPPAPVASSVTPTSIVWTVVTGTKITCNSLTKDSGSTWTNLTPETMYTAIAYYPESTTLTRSLDSTMATARTISSKVGSPTRSARTPLVVRAPSAPVASNVMILSDDGNIQVGTRIHGLYTYSHSSNLPESGSTVVWYRADSISGPWLPIGAPVSCESNTPIYYILTPSDNGKYIKIGITPRTGTVPYAPINVGVEAFSDPSAEINAVEVPPMASNVKIQKFDSGVYIDIDSNHLVGVGDTLKGVFTYYDANNDPIGECIYRWYRSLTQDPDGEYELILGGDGNPYSDIVYITRDEDYNLILQFEVTPVSI